MPERPAAATRPDQTAYIFKRGVACTPCCGWSATQPRSVRVRAFTLIELLAVITILGIIASLAVPAIKNLGKSNVAVSAARQLLDDVGHARQLAITHRTTVYMVFLQTNFWAVNDSLNHIWYNDTIANNLLPLSQQAMVTNLSQYQLTGYNFVSHGALADQPGNHQWHYLGDWQTLPDNSFIAGWKFYPRLPAPQYWYSVGSFPVNGFSTTNNIPFPNTNSCATPVLPYIAFNYLGQLTVDGVNPSFTDEYIPLAQGTVAYGYNGTTKSPNLNLVGPSGVVENPPGNSSSSMFTLIHIDALTGRARLEFQHVQ